MVLKFVRRRLSLRIFILRDLCNICSMYISKENRRFIPESATDEFQKLMGTKSGLAGKYAHISGTHYI